MILGKRQEIKRKKETSLLKKPKNFHGGKCFKETLLLTGQGEAWKGPTPRGQGDPQEAAKTCQDTCALPTCVCKKKMVHQM